jgi:hypothetical protein
MLNLPCGGNHLEFAITEKKINFLVFEDFFPVWAFVKTMRRFFLDIRNPPVRSQKAPRNDGINFICTNLNILFPRAIPAKFGSIW